MDKRTKQIIGALVFSVAVTFILLIVSLFKGTFDLKGLFIVLGVFSFFSVILTVGYQMYADLLYEFLESNTKGRLIIIMIVIAAVLRAITGYVLSK